MVGNEESEGLSRDRMLELEAPDFLAPGQNFYEQPPFDQLLADLATQGIDRKLLASILTRLSRRQQTLHNPDDPSPSALKRRMMRDLKQVVRGIHPISYDRYAPAVNRLLDDLSAYPLWHEYIWTQCVLNLYAQDGSYIDRANKPSTAVLTTAPSYARWVTSQLQSSVGKRLSLVGLGDVLPAGYPIKSLATPEVGQGKSPVRRRWAIKAATEVTKERLV